MALSLPGGPGHGDTDGPISLDVPDGAPDPQRTKAAIDHLHQKILKITEQIKIEQEARDDNVAEYLKLANNADKQQVSRIKQVFEKKNQKSAQTIAQLHKKLEHYRRRLREIEQNGPSRQPKDVLRDMQQGLKDVGANMRAGISGFGGGVVEGVKGSLSGLSQATHTAVVSKPREFASLIRNKFGSADNIAHLKDPLDDGPPEEAARALSGSATLVSSPKYGSDDECSSASASSAGAGSNSGAGPAAALGSPKSNMLYGAPGNLDAVLEELREIKEGQSHLEDSMEDLKAQLQRDYTYMTQCLQEERYRCVPPGPPLGRGAEHRLSHLVVAADGGASRRVLGCWKGPGRGSEDPSTSFQGSWKLGLWGLWKEGSACLRSFEHPYLMITWLLYKRGNRGRSQLHGLLSGETLAKSTDSGARLPGFRSQLYYLLFTLNKVLNTLRTWCPHL